MIHASDLRKGTKILYNDEPYIVISFQWTKPGKGGAFIRTKMKNMISGLVHEATFRSEDKLAAPDLAYREMQYLYNEDSLYHFMDQETFDQVALNKNQIDEVSDYLKEETIYIVLYFDDKPITVTPPLFMELEVTETPPGVRGDTAQGAATKPATLETGLVLQVPLFITQEDIIKVDTREGKYIERVKK